MSGISVYKCYAMPINLAVELTLDGLEVVSLHSGSLWTIYDTVRASCQTSRCSHRQLLWHGSQNFAILFIHRVKSSNYCTWVLPTLL